MSNATAVRQVMVKVHRYVGLALAPFIIIIAATGSIITFYDELETAVNWRLRVVEPQETAWTLQDLLAVRERLEAQDPRSHVFSLQFPQKPNESVFSRVQGAIDPATGKPFELDYTEVFANPYTGERLGERFFGNFSLQPEDLISQIYFLHYALVLPELLGALVVGTVGLIWAFDCFVGFYLTLPPGGGGSKRKGPDAGRKSFFSRWQTAWQIKRGAGANRLVYDTHRASSLWLWPLLLLFAWTGFALNLPGYYAPIMNSITDYEHLQELQHRPPLAQPLIDPPVDWYQALQLGQRYLAEQAQAQGFDVERPAALEYRRDLGTYFYLAHTSRDLRDGATPTETDTPASAATIAIDARDGRLLGVQIPTGQRAGNTFTSWIIALHVTSVFGLPWQIAVSLIGILVVVITVTGVLIWWRKRRSRGSRARIRDPLGAASVGPKALDSLSVTLGGEQT
jgi:uncharacterized iron-regulated membrane protein